MTDDITSLPLIDVTPIMSTSSVTTSTQGSTQGSTHGSTTPDVTNTAIDVTNYASTATSASTSEVEHSPDIAMHHGEEESDDITELFASYGAVKKLAATQT